VSASVNLPLHHKVQEFSYGTGSPGWSQKKGCKTVVCLCASTTSGRGSVFTAVCLSDCMFVSRMTQKLVSGFS